MELDTTAIIKDNKRIGTAVIARFDFNTQKDEQILVNTAISGVSMEGAAKNLQAEVPENDFDKYLAEIDVLIACPAVGETVTLNGDGVYDFDMRIVGKIPVHGFLQI